MESELESKFFKSCAPQFFSEELKQVLFNDTKDENTLRTEFLRTIDTQVSLLNAHNIPLNAIIPETFKNLISLNTSKLTLVSFN